MAAIANNITVAKDGEALEKGRGKREIADRILIAECVF